MSYQEYVLDIFAEHHNDLGVSIEEVEDMINEMSFAIIERWLKNNGYDLNEYYN